MNCNEVLSRLHAYVDGEVSAKLTREMDEHFDACPACRKQVERIRQVGDILDSLSFPLLPQGFTVRVMEEARSSTPLAKQKKSFFSLEWQILRWLLDLSVPMRLAAFATVFLACLLGMFMSKEISLSANRQIPLAGAESLDGFEWLGPSPPASLGSAYLTLALTFREDRNAQ